MTDKTGTNLTASAVFGLTDVFYGVVGVNSRKIAGSAAFTLGSLALGAGTAITSSGPGGAMTALAFTAPGTGIATALGINVGSAGAPVINGGALGTPSSGTLTSATGLPISTGLTGAGTGILTALGINVGSAGAPILFNGAGGTPSSLVGTNISGTAASLTAGNVTTNANLTGPITSVGNATSIVSQTGTGTTFVMSVAPTITGAMAASGTLAVGGAAIGGNAVAVTGSVAISSTTNSANFLVTQATGAYQLPAGGFYYWTGRSQISSPADSSLLFQNAAASISTSLSFPATATLQFGLADAAVAVAQATRVQSIVAGTVDTAGANWTLKGSVPTGAGIPGNVIIQVAGKGAASTTQNTLQDALTIVGATTNNTNVGRPSVVVGNSALATNATDGFLYIPTCAGTPTGTPTAATGRIPMVYDTTTHQFWFYDGGSWLQPKTPAGAAIVTWQ